MARHKSYCIVNVVAHPHPVGTYRRVFEAAGAMSDGVSFYGDLYAKLSPPSQTEDGIFRGRIGIWTEIDQSEPLINKGSLAQSFIDDTNFTIPTDIGFNSKIFYFAFREHDHKLFIETVNDEGQSLSESRALLAVARIFENIELTGLDELMVHLITNKNAIDRVLAVPRIRRIEIKLSLPNPDDLSDAQQMMLDEIRGMNAKTIDTTITKARGEETLVLSPTYRVMAELAKDNGYVTVNGTAVDGQKIERSTKEYPEVVEAILEDDVSSYSTIKSVAQGYDSGQEN